MDKFVTIICKHCGYTKDIQPKEVPKGNCDYCSAEFGFGWVLSPKILMATIGKPNEFKLEPGDILVIDTREHYGSNDRIFSIKRKGEYVYHKELELQKA